MSTSSTHREGFVLVATLFVLVFAAALVTGSFMTASHEDRMSRSLSSGTEALFIADTGLQDVLGTLKAHFFQDSTMDDTVPTAHVLAPVPVEIGGDTVGEYRVTFRRLNSRLLIIVSEGRLVHRGRDNVAMRKVSAVVRLPSAELPVKAALAVAAGLSAGGNSQINGSDSGGPGCMPGDSVAGVAARDTMLIAEPNKDHIYGSPKLAQDMTLDSAKLMNLGSMSVDQLASMADITLPGGELYTGMAPVSMTVGSDQVCNTSNNMNWGDPNPANVCGDYLPIIHITGDAHLTTGIGQGILIVDGDLDLTGNMQFYGIVIVKGTLFTSGNGNHIEGTALVAGGGDLNSTSTTTGNSLVQYSNCRSRAPFKNVLRPIPLTYRNWADISAMAPVPAGW
ncbi:MAG: hypothetical protein P8099_12650 [Gemmatimonadota bacterium]|jgi:hypothetical protein